MTGNPLNQHRYALNAIIRDTGQLSADDRNAIADALGEGNSYFDPTTQQLHVYWSVFADTAEGAMDDGHAVLRRVKEATGGFCPKTTGFEVREIAEEPAA